MKKTLIAFGLLALVGATSNAQAQGAGDIDQFVDQQTTQALDLIKEAGMNLNSMNHANACYFSGQAQTQITFGTLLAFGILQSGQVDASQMPKIQGILTSYSAAVTAIQNEASAFCGKNTHSDTDRQAMMDALNDAGTTLDGLVSNPSWTDMTL